MPDENDTISFSSEMFTKTGMTPHFFSLKSDQMSVSALRGGVLFQAPRAREKIAVKCGMLARIPNLCNAFLFATFRDTDRWLLSKVEGKRHVARFMMNDMGYDMMCACQMVFWYFGFLSFILFYRC